MSNVRNRHPGSAFSRSTHSGIYSPFVGGKRQPAVQDGARAAVEKTALPVSLARDGEQSLAPDLAPKSVVTGTFDPSAAAPQLDNQPARIVDLADPDAVANVWVDADGLHVTDGAIFLTDYSGESVLTAAGFAGSWIEFIGSGVYNGDFNVGYDFGAGIEQTAVHGLGSITTTADYEAALSPTVPFWIMDVCNSGITYGVDYSGATGYHFKAYQSVGAGAAKEVDFFQDVPVTPGFPLEAISRQYFDAGGGTGNWSAYVGMYGSWRDQDHDWISNVSTFASTTHNSAGSNGLTQLAGLIGTPPEDARFFRLSFQIWISGDVTKTDMAVHLQSVLMRRIPHTVKMELAHGRAIGGVDMAAYPSVISLIDEASERLLVHSTGLGMVIDIGTGLATNYLSVTNDGDGSGDTNVLSISEGGALEWGANRDLGLYRDSTGTLRVENEYSSAATKIENVGYARSASYAQWFAIRDHNDSGYSVRLGHNGTDAELSLGPGNSSVDVTLTRDAANVLKLASGDRMHMDGWLQQLGASYLYGRTFNTYTGAISIGASWTEPANSALRVTYPANASMSGKNVVLRITADLTHTWGAATTVEQTALYDYTGSAFLQVETTDVGGVTAGNNHHDSVSFVGAFAANTARTFGVKIQRPAGASNYTLYGHASATYVSAISYEVIGYY